MFNPMSLEGKRILVMGASSGIGRAVAILASRLGAHLFITGRNQAALDETLCLMEGASRHKIIVGDLTDEAFIKSLPGECAALDGFVHSAGICRPMPISVVGEKQLLQTMSINYFAFMRLMAVFASGKNVNEGFSAVAVSSVSSSSGWAGGSVYAASKGALESAVRSLAVELAPRKIRVNAVCPANIKTPLSDNLAKATGEKAEESLTQSHPLGFGSPEDVALVISFLLSNASSYMTGTLIPVDGGFLSKQ